MKAIFAPAHPPVHLFGKPIHVTNLRKESNLHIVSDERKGMWGMDVAITVAM